MRLICLALMVAGITACGFTPRQQAHHEFMSQFYYVDQPGFDPALITAEGPVYGDCDDAAFSYGYRQNWACKPWMVRVPGKGTFHAVCLYPDGYYFDNRTPFGSTDKTRYHWVMEIPYRTVPVR